MRSRNWLIHKLGGQTKCTLQHEFNVKELISHLRDADAEERYDLLQEVMRDLFLAINPDDILRKEDGVVTFLGKPLRDDQVSQLKEEAKRLQTSKLWAVIKTDVRYQLSRKMFEEGRLKEDFIWGQLATYLFDVIKTRIDKLSV